MESYVNLKYVPQRAHSDGLRKFFEACCESDEDELRSAAKALAPAFNQRFEELLDEHYFADYIKSASPPTRMKSCDPGFTAGSQGLTFLIDLLKLIGPYTKSVRATWSHDEEDPQEGEYPYQLYWRNGRVEGSSGTEIESEDDVYAQFASEEEDSEEDGEPEAPTWREVTLPDADYARIAAALKGWSGSARGAVDALQAMQRVCPVLIELEAKHHTGCEMSEDNLPELKEMTEELGGYIRSNETAPWFAQFCAERVDEITQLQELGAIIKRFDDVLLLAAGLVAIVDDPASKDFFGRAVDSQEDFDAWAWWILMMSRGEDS